MSSNEVELMKLFLGSYRNPNVRMFRRQVINKTMQDIHSGAIHQVKAGIVGQADVYGFVRAGEPVIGASGVMGHTAGRGYAYPIEIEFKAHRGRLSDQQVVWQSFCLQWGIKHVILRSDITENPPATLFRWGQELNAIVNTLLGVK